MHRIDSVSLRQRWLNVVFTLLIIDDRILNATRMSVPRPVCEITFFVHRVDVERLKVPMAQMRVPLKFEFLRTLKMSRNRSQDARSECYWGFCGV